MSIGMHKPECECSVCIDCMIKNPKPNTYCPYCLCPTCWPAPDLEVKPMYGPNFTNPMNQAGQFLSEINRLNNHKEAKQMFEFDVCGTCKGMAHSPLYDCRKTMTNPEAPFFPPPHQPKFSAENQEKNMTLAEWELAYGTGNKTIEETIRGQILDTAKGLTTGDRNKSYGPPIDNLTTYANLCTAYIFGKDGNKNDLLALDAVDVAVLMVLAKVSRIAANRGHKDNYVDGAAYMAIAGECDELLGGE